MGDQAKCLQLPTIEAVPPPSTLGLTPLGFNGPYLGPVGKQNWQAVTVAQIQFQSARNLLLFAGPPPPLVNGPDGYLDARFVELMHPNVPWWPLDDRWPGLVATLLWKDGLGLCNILQFNRGSKQHENIRLSIPWVVGSDVQSFCPFGPRLALFDALGGFSGKQAQEHTQQAQTCAFENPRTPGSRLKKTRSRLSPDPLLDPKWCTFLGVSSVTKAGPKRTKDSCLTIVSGLEPILENIILDPVLIHLPILCVPVPILLFVSILLNGLHFTPQYARSQLEPW